MLRALSWIISIVLLAVAVIFSVNHRQPVTVDLWPLPMEVAPPLYVLVLVGIFLGFVVGGTTTWLSQGRHRRRARERRYRMERLERDLQTTQRKLDALRRENRPDTGEQPRVGAAPNDPEALPPSQAQA